MITNMYRVFLLIILAITTGSSRNIYTIGESYDFDMGLLNCDEPQSSKDYGDIFDVDYKVDFCLVKDEEYRDTLSENSYLVLNKMVISKIRIFEKIEFDTLLSMLNSKYGSSREVKIRSSNLASLGFPNVIFHQYKRVWKSNGDLIIMKYTRLFDDEKMNQVEKQYKADLKNANESNKQLIEAVWVSFNERAKPTVKYVGYTSERVYHIVKNHVERKSR